MCSSFTCVMCWCVGVSVGSNSFIFSGRSLSCLTWQKGISGLASLQKKNNSSPLRGLWSKIHLWEFVKKCGWGKKSFIFADFLQGEGGCNNCDDEAVKRGLLFTHAVPSQGWNFILSFCLSVNKSWNWLHTPSPHESQPLILFHSIWEEEAQGTARVNYIPNAI